MNRSIEISRKVSLAYRKACRPLCKELGLPQTAFHIGKQPLKKCALQLPSLFNDRLRLIRANQFGFSAIAPHLISHKIAILHQSIHVYGNEVCLDVAYFHNVAGCFISRIVAQKH